VYSYNRDPHIFFLTGAPLGVNPALVHGTKLSRTRSKLIAELSVGPSPVRSHTSGVRGVQGHRVNWVSGSLDSRVTGSKNVTEFAVWWTVRSSCVPGVQRGSVERVERVLAVAADRLPRAVERVSGTERQRRRASERRQRSRWSRLDDGRVHRALLLRLANQHTTASSHWLNWKRNSGKGGNVNSDVTELRFQRGPQQGRI